MSKRLSAILLFTATVSIGLQANNIQVSNTTLVDNNGTTAKVQFDISWENSWRGGGVNNWDAAWVFVKYRQGVGAWQHVNLNSSGHTAPAGSMLENGLVAPASPYNATTNPVVGVFIRRDADGNGTFAASGVQLSWNYGALGIAYNDISEVQVFAIEMVYVNQGAFRLGSGGSEDNHFKVAGTNDPYPVQSEAAMNMNSLLGLWADGAIEGAALPAAFPKGYNAFYCMKYEVTQQQYVDFLNTLDRTQQASRIRTPIIASATSETNVYVMSNAAISYSGDEIQCPSSFQSGVPIPFTTTARWSAMGRIFWQDLLAYLDWSGMRPMSELEFEKACRGPLSPVVGEYAWGNSTVAVAQSYTFSNLHQIDEGIAANYGTNVGNCLFGRDLFFEGPMRVGAFAANSLNTGRVTAGASYYGIMELSGNCFESTVSVEDAESRAFTGAHGDGALSTSSDHNAGPWPSSPQHRGGSYSVAGLGCTVSLRNPISGSGGHGGGRGVRTVP